MEALAKDNEQKETPLGSTKGRFFYGSKDDPTPT